MDADLKGMLNTTITRKPVTARSTTGTETLGAAVVVAAYVENKTRWSPRADGGFDRATYPRVVTETEIKLTDRVWLAGDSVADVTKSRRVVSVNKFFEPENPNVVSHYETDL